MGPKIPKEIFPPAQLRRQYIPCDSIRWHRSRIAFFAPEEGHPFVAFDGLSGLDPSFTLQAICENRQGVLVLSL